MREASRAASRNDEQRRAVRIRGLRVRRVAAMAFCLVACTLAYSSAIGAEFKRILMLHSFGRDFRPWNEYAKTIRAELYRQSRWPLDIQEHSLITARSSDQSPEGPFVEYLRVLFSRDKPDLIVSIGAPAAAFVQRHRQQLFPETPMVLTAVDQRRIQYSVLTANDVVVAVSIDYFAAIDNILRVLPDTKQVAVVAGSSPLEKWWSEEIAREIKPFADRIAFTWYNQLSFEDILKHAAALPPHSAIFWELMIVDAAGVVHEGDTALARLYDVANAPIFSYDDGFFGRELVGGPLLSVREGSRQTAAVAIRILSGESAGSIKVPPIGFAAPKFDWREMRRWGIPESRLSPVSEILFREATVWDTHRWQIATIALVMVLQTTLIVGLLYEHRRRRTAEAAARQRMSELAHMNRHATAGELSASIAHEVNQPLGAILNSAEAVELVLKSPSPNLEELKEIAADIKRDNLRASAVIKRLRRLHAKSPPELQDIDINETVSEVVDFLSAQATAREVSLDTTLAPQIQLVRGDRIQLQQVILNLVMNSMEAFSGSASATRRIIGRTASIESGFVEVSISDTGPGIPFEKLAQIFEPFYTTKEGGMGMGLSIVRTIIEAHGGKIWAENQADGGAIFRLKLPAGKVPATHVV